jgi:ubiquinone/menaquinone biosynthesis C-methylase UbiE
MVYNKKASKMNNKRICPVERAGGLDNSFRKLLQDPHKILSSYIRQDMDVLDLGCGPGYFTVEIAKLLKGTGKVIAADLQPGMLAIVKNKIIGTELEERVLLHQCEASKIGITDKVDFALAFYMIHEVPDQKKLFMELRSILKPDGKLYIIEPKFHVTKKMFNNMIDRLIENGFKIVDTPKVFFSRAILANCE